MSAKRKPVDVPEGVGTRLGNLSELPKAITDQLKSSPPKWGTVEYLIGELDGVATIDEILVKWYRTYDEVIKRTELNHICYRMVKAGRLYPCGKKRGTYSLKPA